MRALIKEFFQRALKLGTVLQDRYEIKSYIGRGSYGMVYLAYDLDSQTTVIVKQNRVRRGKNTRSMLAKEARTLTNLSHPSIPKYLNFFDEGESSFLVMEYIDGKNFEDLVINEGKKYEEKESLYILLKVLRIVKYLHDNKLIHRDLRLPNIISNNNEIYIIDFGLAVPPESKAVLLVNSNNALFREPSFNSDFYALGHFILFLLYSNYQPTTKIERSWEEELTISGDTRALIKRMLRLEGSYEHIEDVLIDVENCLS
ncbi:protein kinase [Bacillus sp. 31A1R]|uniref:non-specific serine/threonine protein kinase n=1 Tax=Robertmurraya mangrovi TaxID=3098077 RepID=A0ABU5IWG1_9BACI|nr:protein kinase [Bacillus sp. 31A1R]MDZ5471451.1 protein kinase [Bacillus sp. 31A1R]